MSSDSNISENINTGISNLDIKGDEIQKLSVVRTVPSLAKVEQDACYDKVIPRIQQALPSSSAEFHVATSKMFCTLLEKKLSAETLVCSAIQGLESSDLTVSSAWLDALLNGIAYLPIGVVCSEILPVAKQKGEPTQLVPSRIISCRLLGRISAHSSVDNFMVKKEVLPTIHSLCQDVSYEVRAVVCQQLPFVAQGLGIELVKSTLLPCLVELSTDDNGVVRVAAAEIIVQMFPFLTEDVMKYTIVPMVLKLCEQSIRNEDHSAIIIAREIGRLCHGLSSCLSTNNAIFFINSYRQLALRGITVEPGESYRDPYQDVTCRQHCAFNLPAMTLYTLSASPQSIEQLYTVFTTLATDPCYLVRRTVASGVHEIAKCLGPQVNIIKDEIIKLLRDESEEVLQCLVPHITSTFLQLMKHNVLQVQHVDGTIIEFGKALLKCESSIGNTYNWRLYTNFLFQLECLPLVFPGDFIYTQFLPIVFNKVIKGRAKPCRQQAGRTLLKFLRYNNKPQQRTEIRNRIITDLCHSQCCYTRNIYIRLCTDVFELFSTLYFKEHFYVQLLSLSGDKIANIRLCVIMLFPKLKAMIRLPADRRLLSLFDQTVTKLENEETDVDCRQILSSVMSQLQKINVLTEQDKVNTTEQRLIDEENQPLVKNKSNVRTRLQNYTASDNKKLQSSNRGSPRTSATNQPLSNRASPVTSNISHNSRQSNIRPKDGNSSRSIIQPKSIKKNAETNSDMTILQQHFYIDAGINLPLNAMQDDQVSQVEKVNHTFIKKHDNSQINKVIFSTSNKLPNESVLKTKTIKKSSQFIHIQSNSHNTIISQSNLNTDDVIKTLDSMLHTKNLEIVPTTKAEQLNFIQSSSIVLKHPNNTHNFVDETKTFKITSFQTANISKGAIPKVNKAKSKPNLSKINKRHSMIENKISIKTDSVNSAFKNNTEAPNECSKNHISPIHKRRSLDITSKIPISNKNSGMHGSGSLIDFEPKINKPKFQCQINDNTTKDSDFNKRGDNLNNLDIDKITFNENSITEDSNIIDSAFCEPIKPNLVLNDKNIKTELNENLNSLNLQSVQVDSKQSNKIISSSSESNCLLDNKTPNENSKPLQLGGVAAIGNSKLRLRKSNSGDSKLQRNVRNRYSLPAGSSLPIPVRK